MEVTASDGKQCNTANIRIQTKAIGQASWRNVTGGNPQPPQTSRNSLRASWVEVWLGTLGKSFSQVQSCHLELLGTNDSRTFPNHHKLVGGNG